MPFGGTYLVSQNVRPEVYFVCLLLSCVCVNFRTKSPYERPLAVCQPMGSVIVGYK